MKSLLSMGRRLVPMCLVTLAMAGVLAVGACAVMKDAGPQAQMDVATLQSAVSLAENGADLYLKQAGDRVSPDVRSQLSQARAKVDAAMSDLQKRVAAGATLGDALKATGLMAALDELNVVIRHNVSLPST